jgi:solute carrier family 25 carnitine/acylcarnitine transporter 20/29
MESITYGALAGLAFWIPSFPIDVIKTKLQADSIKAPKYLGALDCARQTWRESGLRAFYKGFTPCFLRAAPVNAATFVVYEWASQALKG